MAPKLPTGCQLVITTIKLDLVNQDFDLVDYLQLKATLSYPTKVLGGR